MKVTIKDVRLAFPDLFEARAFKGSGDPKFGASFLFAKDHPAVKEIENAIEKVAKEKWKDKAATILKGLRTKNDTCLHDGDTKPEIDGYEGNFYISARSSVRPTVVDRDRTRLEKSDGRPYGGCYVNAIIDIWAMDSSDFGKRVCASLMGVQFVRDGEAFAGGTAASPDEFEELEDEESLV